VPKHPVVNPSDLEGQKLPKYQGHQVVETPVKIENAGAAFSEGLELSPLVVPVRSRVFVVLELDVVSHEYDAVKTKKDEDESDDFVLTHVTKCTRGWWLDPEEAEAILDVQSEKLVLAREAAAGIQRLGDAEDDDPLA
jgi:hypothetical protein